MPSLSKPHHDPDRYYEGEWRRPVNDLRNQHVGGGHKSVHDDATAAAAGLRGAPVHGTVHFSQLTPLLLRAFGPAWFERGTLSVVFRNVVTHLQPVKAFCEKNPEGGPIEVWMEHADGRLVFDGTASLGGDAGGTAVDRQIKRVKPLRRPNLVCVPHPVGTRTVGVEEARLEWGRVIGPLFPFTPERKLEVITEWHPWFSRERGHLSPWKRAVLPPEGLNQIMLYTMTGARWPGAPYRVLPEGRTAVELFGACEVRLIGGPVFMGETYYISRELIGVGETPRTEFHYVRTTMRDKSGKKIAEMTLQSMMLKSTVEGYEELRASVNRESKL